MAIKLEVGKYYKNKKGEVIGPIELLNNRNDYCYVCNTLSYREDGVWSIDQTDNLLNLVEEVKPPETFDPQTLFTSDGKSRASMINETPKSDKLSPGIEQIPFCALERIGAIFAEGEPKCGRDNWKKDPGNVEYNRERLRHALRHLHLYAEGDTSEDHLAKVAWFCVTTMWRGNNAQT